MLRFLNLVLNCGFIYLATLAPETCQMPGNALASPVLPNALWSHATCRIPDDWIEVSAGPFSILAPKGWEFHKLLGIDSYVGEFAGDGIVLTFDFGVYNSSFDEAKKPKYSIVHEKVDGHPAKIVSPREPGQGVTGIHIKGLGNSNTLRLWAQDLTNIQQELVLKIFRSIQFGKRHSPSRP